MLREVAIQHGLSLFFGLSPLEPQLADESVLKGVPKSLNAPLGLG